MFLTSILPWGANQFFSLVFINLKIKKLKKIISSSNPSPLPRSRASIFQEMQKLVTLCIRWCFSHRCLIIGTNRICLNNTQFGHFLKSVHFEPPPVYYFSGGFLNTLVFEPRVFSPSKTSSSPTDCKRFASSSLLLFATDRAARGRSKVFSASWNPRWNDLP